MESADVKKRRPKVQPVTEVKIRGMADGVKLVLVEFDGENEKVVPEDVKREPGKTYFYKREA